jgi:hypothetical protein
MHISDIGLLTKIADDLDNTLSIVVLFFSSGIAQATSCVLWYFCLTLANGNSNVKAIQNFCLIWLLNIDFFFTVQIMSTLEI